MTTREIRDALSSGPVSVRVGKRTVSLEKLSGSYHLTIVEPDKKPKVWQYGNMKIAIDRFQKNLSVLRRSL